MERGEGHGCGLVGFRGDGEMLAGGEGNVKIKGVSFCCSFVGYFCWFVVLLL